MGILVFFLLILFAEWGTRSGFITELTAAPSDVGDDLCRAVGNRNAVLNILPRR